jgi:hypothetical protein
MGSLSFTEAIIGILVLIGAIGMFISNPVGAIEGFFNLIGGFFMAVAWFLLEIGPVLLQGIGEFLGGLLKALAEKAAPF